MFDKFNYVAEAQAFTATAVATSSLALKKAGLDIGVGHEPIVCVFSPTVAPSVNGTQTYELQIVSATDEDGTTGQEVLITTGTIATADVLAAFTVGKPLVLPVPEGKIPSDATHITAKLVGANSPTVTMDIYFCPQSAVQRWKAYPAAITSI